MIARGKNEKKSYSNLVYMIKLIFKADPWKIPVALVKGLSIELYYLFFSIVLIQMLYSIIENGEPFINAFFIISVFTLLHGALQWCETWCVHYFEPMSENKTYAYVYNMIIEKAVKTEFEKYDDPKFYDEYTRAVNEAHSRIQSLTNLISNSISEGASMILIIYLISMFDPLLAIIAGFLPVFVTIVTGKAINKLNYKMNQELTTHDRAAGYARRIFTEIKYSKDLRLTNISSFLLKKHTESHFERIKIIKGYSYKISLLEFLKNFTEIACIRFGVFFFISYKMLSDPLILLASYIAMINAVHLLGGNITGFLNSIVRFGGESMLIQNLRRFLESEPVCPDGEKMPESMQSIEFKQVSFTYPSAEKTVLENINLTIRKGEKISIVGLNGAGKTTLVKLLLGLYNPTAGNIYYNGVDVHEYDKNSYQRCFATVFQDFQLFALPVKTNVKMDCVTEPDFIKIDEALETAKFFENNHATTESVLTKEYGEDGIVLSGGQAQKLAMARAFYHEGEIIVLDEPSSALDPIAENEAYMNMLHAAKNRTVIIISHRLSTAAMADRIILIDGKHIKESGNHEELMNIKGLYYDMFTKQAEKYKIKGEI